MEMFAPNQWKEAVDPCSWIRGKLEEAEEKGDPVGGPAVSLNLDSWDLSNHGPPTRQHKTDVMKPKHIYSGALPGLGLVREDAPNP